MTQNNEHDGLFKDINDALEMGARNANIANNAGQAVLILRAIKKLDAFIAAVEVRNKVNFQGEQTFTWKALEAYDD